MLDTRRTSQTKATGKPGKDRGSYDVRLEQLRDEIDRLALLVNEAKRQSDRIQAVADALGDAMLDEARGQRGPVIPLLRPVERVR